MEGLTMVREALNKLNEKQKNALKEEFERNSGKLRGFLECLCQMEVITGAELKSLYLWFFAKDRNYRCK